MLIIKIKNDGTGNEKIGNYTYEVFINATTIETGVVSGHERKSGWRDLLRMILLRVPTNAREDYLMKTAKQLIDENKDMKMYIVELESKVREYEHTITEFKKTMNKIDEISEDLWSR